MLKKHPRPTMTWPKGTRICAERKKYREKNFIFEAGVFETRGRVPRKKVAPEKEPEISAAKVVREKGDALPLHKKRPWLRAKAINREGGDEGKDLIIKDEGNPRVIPANKNAEPHEEERRAKEHPPELILREKTNCSLTRKRLGRRLGEKPNIP